VLPEAQDLCPKAAAGECAWPGGGPPPVVTRDGTWVGIMTDRDFRHPLSSSRVFQGSGANGVHAGGPGAEIMAMPVVNVRPRDELLGVARPMPEAKVRSPP
jgi:CBS domain-containing protein